MGANGSKPTTAGAGSGAVGGAPDTLAQALAPAIANAKANSAQALASFSAAAQQHLTALAAGHVQDLHKSIDALGAAAQNLCPKVGGGEDDGRGYFGGGAGEPAKGLAGYAASESAAFKGEMIRAMARALKDAGIAVDPSDDADRIIRQVAESLPNPYDTRPGKAASFSADAEAQKAVCRSLADVFNNRFTPGAKGDERMVNGSTAPEICRQVAELARSFTTSANLEFLQTYVSLRNAMETLKLLTESMNAAEASVVSSLQASGDPELLRKVDPVHAVYDSLRAEQRRCLAIIENQLNLELPPAAQILAKYAEEDATDHFRLATLVKRLGTGEFGDSIAATLLGVNRAAAAAQTVNKSLAKLGLQVRDFLDSESFRALRAQALALVKDHPDKMAATLHELAKVQDLFSQRTDPAFREAIAGIRTGGAPPLSAVEKRVKRAKDDRSVVLKAFAADLGAAYREFLGAVRALIPKLGKEVPLTEKTDRLREAVVRLSDVRAAQKSIEFALIGRYNDSDARERKERFLSALGLVASACEEILPLELYRESSSDFARVKNSIDSISRVVDSYARAMEAQSSMPVRGGGPEEDAETEFSSLSSLLEEAVRSFIYHYYVAGVKENLAQTASEHDVYGESYETLLGDAIAARLYSIEEAKNKLMGAIRPSLALQGIGRGGVAWLPAHAEVTAAAGGGPGTTEAMLQAHAEVKKHILAMFAAKVKFYRALQAVDLYLKAFDRGLARDPDSCRGIKKMLEGTQVIARWFGETTGDSLWKTFEYCNTVIPDPAVMGPGALGIVAPGVGPQVVARKEAHPDEHYYQSVRHVDDSGLGVPETGMQPTGREDSRFGKIRKCVSETVDFFQALKNLTNAFVRIGDEFGGSSVRSQIFMSPDQIYKALVEYLKVSAVEIRFPPRGDLAEFGPAPGGAQFLPYAPPRIGARVGVAGAASPVDCLQAVSGFEAWFPEVTQDVRFFNQEDKYFAHIIKAMGAKILTTLGVYDMLERPAPLYDLTPTRMILGGGDPDPTPIAEAAELYFRLPRLAEFYREFLSWDGVAQAGTMPINTNRYKIAMLPELEGIFSGLIALVFVRAVNPMNGDYSEQEMKVLIEEANRIYSYYKAKDPDRPVKAALSALVIEVNRRYGLVKDKDMKEYLSLVRLERTGQPSREENNTHYAILPGEGETSPDLKAPSDRFGVAQYQRFDPLTGLPIDPETGSASTPFAGRMGLQGNAEQLLRNFRVGLDKAFGGSQEGVGVQNFSAFIRQAKDELATSEATLAEKQKIAFRLIQDGNLAEAGSNRLLAFHETVVTGLNLLCAIESILRRFSNALTVMNPIQIESAITDSLFLHVQAQHLVDGEINAPVGARVALAAGAFNRAALLAIIAGAFPGLVPGAANPAGADLGAVVTIHDRYILDRAASVDGRSGAVIPAGAGLLYDVVYDGLAAEYGIFQGLGVQTGVDNVGVHDLISQFMFGENGEESFPPKKGEELLIDRLSGLRRDGGPHADADIRAECRFANYCRSASRYLVDYPRIMEDFVEALFAITAGGLVTVSFTQPGAGAQGIHLNFSRLRSLSEQLLASVKEAFEKFRPHLPKPLIDRYEKKSETGSIFWIEDRLVDVMFRGIPSADSPQTLEGISRRANSVLRGLSRQMHAPMRGVNLAAFGNAAAAARLAATPRIVGTHPDVGGLAVDAADSREWYGSTMSRLVYWDSNSNFFGRNADINMGLGFSRAQAAAKFRNLVFPGVAEPAGGAAGPAGVVLPNRDWVVPIWGDPSMGFTDSRSLVFSLNQLVSMYLDVVVDHSAVSKVYSPLIEGLTSGVLSSAISQPLGKTIPDFRVEGASPGTWGDPQPEVILLHSLACVLHRLTFATTGLNPVPKHLVSTLTDVMLHMKESYRVNLPIFSVLFSRIRDKAEFLKDFFQKLTDLDLSRASQVAVLEQRLGAGAIGVGGTVSLALQNAGAAGAPAAPGGAGGGVAANFYVFENGPPAGAVAAARNAVAYQLQIGNAAGESRQTAFLPFAPEMRDGAMRVKLYEVIGNVSTTCYSVITAVDGVSREIGDQPRFFQVQDGSIETYRMQYGKDPLMPLSLSLLYLGDVQQAAATPGADATLARYHFSYAIPGKPNGTMPFRLQYGHRGLIFGKAEASPETLPWVSTLVSTFGSSMGAGDALTASAVWAFAKSALAAIRWAAQVRSITPLLARSTALPIGSVVILAGAPNQFSLVNQGGPVSRDGLVYPAPMAAAAALARNAVYSFPDQWTTAAANESKILSVVENTNQPDEVRKIITSFGGARQTTGRSKQRLYNLMDINIIPINVHALMRDIPLANLYNHGLTFEQMVNHAFGVVPAGNGAAPRSAQFFSQLIEDPYRQVSYEEYGLPGVSDSALAPVQRLFRGDVGNGMGRPRFLSDQIFNKSLFGSIYPSADRSDEAGPTGLPRDSPGTLLAWYARIERNLRAVLDMMRRRFAIVPGNNAAAVRNGITRGNSNQYATYMIGNGGAIDPGSVWARYLQPVLDEWQEFWAALPAALQGGNLGAINVILAAVRVVPAGAQFLQVLALDAGAGRAAGLAAMGAGAALNAAGDLIRDVMRAIFPPLLGADAMGAALIAMNPPPRALVEALPIRPLGEAREVPAHEALTFLVDDAEDRMVRSVALGPNLGIDRLVHIGKSRFDTTFVRKILLITQVQRLVRLRLNRTLTHDRSVLLSSHESVAPGVTEYGFDPYTPNEVTDSRPRGLNLGAIRDARGAWPAGSATRWLDGRK